MYTSRNDFKIGQTVRIKISGKIRNRRTNHYFSIDGMTGYICRIYQVVPKTRVGVIVKNYENQSSSEGIWWLHQEELELISETTDNATKDKNGIQVSFKDLIPGTRVKFEFNDDSTSHKILNNSIGIIYKNNRSSGIKVHYEDVINSQTGEHIWKIREKHVNNFEVIDQPNNKFAKGDIVYKVMASVKSIRFSKENGYMYYLELLPQIKNNHFTRKWYREDELICKDANPWTRVRDEDLRIQTLLKREKDEEMNDKNLTYENLIYASNIVELTAPKIGKDIQNEEEYKEGEYKMGNLLEEVMFRANQIVKDVLYEKLCALDHKVAEETEAIEKTTNINKILDKHSNALKDELKELNSNRIFDVKVINFCLRSCLTEEEKLSITEITNKYLEEKNILEGKFERVTNSIRLCTTPEQVNEFLNVHGFVDCNGLIISPEKYWENNKK